MGPKKNIFKLFVESRVIAIISLFAIGFGCHNTKIQSMADAVRVRLSIMKIVKEIAKENILESENVGFAGARSMQWQRFEKLYNLATNAELRTLTNYDNAVVRCYSFYALAVKKDTAVFAILLHHLSDTAQVSTLNYDLGGGEMVGDFLIDLTTPNYIGRSAYKLNLSQKEKVDSVLLYNNSIRLSSKETLLSKIKTNPKYYNRIREIAINENNPASVLALSRYNNPNDTGIINAYLAKPNNQYYVVYAVREFPAAEFYPKLLELFNKEWNNKYYDYPLWRMIYQALAKYPKKETIALFERTVDAKGRFRRQTLGEDLLLAVTKYPNSLFQNIKNEISLDDYNRDQFNQDMKDSDEN